MSQNGNNKQVVNCPHCNQRFSVKIPAMDMFNDLRVSTVIAAHEKPIRCMSNTCAKYFVLGFKAVQVAWVVIPITGEQAASLDDPNVIVAPAGVLGHLH